VNAHTLYVTDESGADTEQVLAEVKPAPQALVDKVLAAPTTGHDGRSEWVFVRLQNGDLILGVFPQGDTYCECEGEAP